MTTTIVMPIWAFCSGLWFIGLAVVIFRKGWCDKGDIAALIAGTILGPIWLALVLLLCAWFHLLGECE